MINRLDQLAIELRPNGSCPLVINRLGHLVPESNARALKALMNGNGKALPFLKKGERKATREMRLAVTHSRRKLAHLIKDAF